MNSNENPPLISKIRINAILGTLDNGEFKPEYRWRDGVMYDLRRLKKEVTTLCDKPGKWANHPENSNLLKKQHIEGGTNKNRLKSLGENITTPIPPRFTALQKAKIVKMNNQNRLKSLTSNISGMYEGR